MALAETMTAGQALEAAMLICFGVSWPVDILKAVRTRATAGKSMGFMDLVLTGYVFGLAAKCLRAAQAGTPPEAVTALYVLNAVFIAVDIALYMRFRPRASGDSVS